MMKRKMLPRWRCCLITNGLIGGKWHSGTRWKTNQNEPTSKRQKTKPIHSLITSQFTDEASAVCATHSFNQMLRLFLDAWLPPWFFRGVFFFCRIHIYNSFFFFFSFSLFSDLWTPAKVFDGVFAGAILRKSARFISVFTFGFLNLYWGSQEFFIGVRFRGFSCDSSSAFRDSSSRRHVCEDCEGFFEIRVCMDSWSIQDSWWFIRILVISLAILGNLSKASV